MNSPTRLVSELRDRSVWQVAGSYAVGAWLVLQLGETLSSLLGLPLWFGSAVVALLVAGFPIVLVAGSLYTRGREAAQVPQRFNRRTTGLAAEFARLQSATQA